MKSPDYEKSVFINCPFDKEYARLFRAIVFTIHYLEFRPCCAANTGGATSRIHKLFELIRESKYGIHDISRTETDGESNLPRFNMPFELGLDLGCKEFNPEVYGDKHHLILDSEAHRYQQSISDLAGYDPPPHGNKPEKVVQIVSDWLREILKQPELPNGRRIYADFRNFETDYKLAKKSLPKKPSFADFSYAVADWIKQTREIRSKD